jgi:hypothetical protein
VANNLNESVDNFVRNLTRRACRAAEAAGGKSKRRTIEHDHVLAALDEMGAGHLCEDVRQVALTEEEAEKANVRPHANIS